MTRFDIGVKSGTYMGALTNTIWKGKNMVWKRIAPIRRIVLDVDTQRHFFDKESSVCVQSPERIKRNIENVMAWAWVNHIPIVSTIQMHQGESCLGLAHRFSSLSNEKIIEPQGGTALRFESEDATDLQLDEIYHYDQVIFYKRTFNPFDEPRLDRLLTNIKVDEILLMGCPKEGAVLATLLGLQVRQKPITLIKDAIGSLSGDLGQPHRERMEAKSKKIIRTQTLIKREIPFPQVV